MNGLDLVGGHRGLEANGWRSLMGWTRIIGLAEQGGALTHLVVVRPSTSCGKSWPP